MLPLFVENQLTGGSEAVSLILWLPFTPGEIPDTNFCYRLRGHQGHSVAGRIRSIEKSNGLIGNQNRDLPACSTVPHPDTFSVYMENFRSVTFAYNVRLEIQKR
jgi:hypothetical protein